MKIISKYKDYYDYLTGIYGIDEKLVLDRREKDTYLLPSVGKITLYIAGYVIEGLVINSNIFYGEDLKQFIVEKYNSLLHKYKWLSKHTKREYDKSIHVKYESEENWYYTEPVKDQKDTNIIHNCPILIKTAYGLKKYPKLSVLKLASFLPAETIYKLLSEWLSNQITNKEQSKPMTDNQKIQSKGFDKKRSFRPKMK